jgi:hypothetical protein
MKTTWLAACGLALGACATSQTSSLHPSSAQTAGASAATIQGEVREVAIESYEDVTTCRRYVPTGSRIATRDCSPPSDPLASEQAREDVESLRRTQMYQEQARQAAMAEALRRRSAAP